MVQILNSYGNNGRWYRKSSMECEAAGRAGVEIRCCGKGMEREAVGQAGRDRHASHRSFFKILTPGIVVKKLLFYSCFFKLNIY